MGLNTAQYRVMVGMRVGTEELDNSKMTKHKIICGDSHTALRRIEEETIDTIITSPAYWGLRDYNVEEQIRLECYRNSCA